MKKKVIKENKRNIHQDRLLWFIKQNFKSERIEIIQSIYIYLDHSGIKLEINNRKTAVKFSNTCALPNTSK